MNIEVTGNAADWFIQELKLKPGDSLRFFGKVYGTRDGFSFGMTITQPSRMLIGTTVKGILFFIDKADEWFFTNADFKIDYDEKAGEPSYHYHEINA